MAVKKFHDLIVIGAGPAGMSAAAAAYDRSVRDVLLLEETMETGGRLRSRNEREAGSRIYHKETGSAYVLQQFRALLSTYEIPTRFGARVNAVSCSPSNYLLNTALNNTTEQSDAVFQITLTDSTRKEDILLARSIILASGKEKEPGITVPDSLSDSSYFLKVGDVTGEKVLPDDAAIDGAKAGREAAELLLS